MMQKSSKNSEKSTQTGAKIYVKMCLKPAFKSHSMVSWLQKYKDTVQNTG